MPLSGNTWYPTAPTRILKYSLEYYFKHKARVHKFDFIGAFLQANVIFFVKLYRKYREYFPEYCNYFGRTLRLKKAMYGITNSGKLF